MTKIIEVEDIKNISDRLKSEDKKIVLVGGFFDILHIGHIKFLQKAKEKGDALFVLLESDEMAKKLKGEKGLRRFIILLAPRHAEKTPSLASKPLSNQTQEKPVPEEVKMSVEEIDKKLAEIFKES